MRNLLNIVLLLMMVVFLSGCSKEKIRYHIGVSQCSGGLWREKQNREMQQELLLYDSIDIDIQCANDDPKKQMQQIQHFINDNVDIIIASPAEEEILKPVIQRAAEVGIPVLLFDRDVSNSPYTAFVGGDNVGVGKQLANFVITRLPQGGKVIELEGSMTTTPAQQRHSGFISEIKDRKDIQLVASLPAEWNGPKAAQLLRQQLIAHPDIDIVVAHNDYMASTAKMSIDSLHLPHKLQFVGVDGFGSLDWGLNAVEKKQIDGTVIYPTGGGTIIETAINILKGKKIAHKTLLPASLVTDSREAQLLLAMNDEMTHESETITRLRDRVAFYGHQQALEETVLLTTAALLVLAICLIITFWLMSQQKLRANESLKQQQDELQKQHDQLLQMTKELEAATNAKLVFFTNVSHDFRTPLTLISAPLETVVSKLENLSTNSLPTGMGRGEAIHLLHIAQRNVKVLLGLINQILDFRKIENGKMNLNFQQADIGHYMRQWVEAFQHYGEQKGINIILDCDRTQDWNIIVDVKKIEGMLYNLIGNAMKFTPRGGTITVGCHYVSNTHLSPLGELEGASNTQIAISVADTGCGIDEEHIKHIFERFYQIDPTQHQGSGIGLALVQTLVTLMHGTIDITSNTDTSRPTGTTITFRLPIDGADSAVASADSAAATSKKASEASPSLSFVTDDMPVSVPDENPVITEDETRQVVLVIDDNTDIVAYMKTLLSDKYHVITANDGQRGLQIAQETVPDIILCDVMMPVMDGMECCRQLKSDVRTSHIPVLMLTACSLDEQRVQGLTEGAEAYISKPFSPAVLMAQIETLLKNRALVMKGRSLVMADTAADNDKTNSQGLRVGEQSSGTHPTTTIQGLRVGEQSSGTHQISQYDQEFLDKMQRRIADGVGDADFNVEALSQHMCLSRVQLYRKCKALTDTTPVELIRNMRLEKGRELLAAGNTTIAAAAKAVGFADPAYFARCYKAYFGVAAKG